MSAEEIQGELEAARADARRLAEQQQEWRARVTELFDRAVAAGISVDEIVDSLGLGAKWAEHLERRAAMRRRFEGPKFFFGGP